MSTDPERDTPPVLRAYLDRFDPRIVGLRGSLTKIAALAESVRIYVDQGSGPAAEYDPNSHSTYVVAINDRHRAPLFWRSETAPSQYAHDIRALLAR